MLMKSNEPNNQIHIPCIHMPTRKLHMQPVICKIFLLKLLIQLYPCAPLLSFWLAFACLLSFLQIQVNSKVLQGYSKCARVYESLKTKLTKAKTNKRCELFL